MLNKNFSLELLKKLLNEHLNIKLIKLENSTKEQMNNLKKTSKNFKEFSKNIQQLINNNLEQEEFQKDKLEKKEENKNINENILKTSIKINVGKSNNNIRNRSNTLGISKYNQLKKVNTENNINRESFISNHNINNKQKSKQKSPEKNNKNNKIVNLTKNMGKNATPKKNNKLDFFSDNKPKCPKTEKIPKKINEKIKKMNTNKDIKHKNSNNKLKDEFDNLYNGNNKQLISSFRKEKKQRNQNVIFNGNYIKKEIDFEKNNTENNINNLKASFSFRKGRKLNINENNIINHVKNNNSSSELNDIQNIVKLVDNVNQNITKLLNNNNNSNMNNNSIDFSLNNNLRNSALFSNEININSKKNEFTLKKKYLSKKEKVKEINVIELFKKDNNIFKNILKYLSQKESIYFYSMNNYLNKGRIKYFDNKKEELLSRLNLKKDETLEKKISEIKNLFSEEDLSQRKKFEITQETRELIKKMNNEEYIDKPKNFKKNDKANENINIIFKILFIFLGEENIYITKNNDIFWKKCLHYFDEKCSGKIGDFLLQKIPFFKFDTKEFNRIENLLKENKTEIINEMKQNTNYLIIPLIKESLEYFGIIFSQQKTEGSLYIKILRKNQIIINYLNNLKVRYFLSKYNEEDDED